MLSINKSNDKFGIQLQGDFFDFDRLYFAIYKLTGQFGVDSKCPFEGYAEVCEYILALCYELRHAYEGDRGLVSVYNGVHEDWFVKDEYDEEIDEDEDDDDFEEQEAANSIWFPKFSQDILKEISYQNAYFSTDISIPAAAFYAMVLEEVIQQVDILKANLLQSPNSVLRELADDYVSCGYREDAALVNLFIGKVWHTLYRVLKNKDYKELYEYYQNKKRKQNGLIFKNCNLDRINQLIEDYYEKSKGVDDPDLLMKTLIHMIETA
jgi:hypothetical protein